MNKSLAVIFTTLLLLTVTMTESTTSTGEYWVETSDRYEWQFTTIENGENLTDDEIEQIKLPVVNWWLDGTEYTKIGNEFNNKFRISLGESFSVVVTGLPDEVYDAHGRVNFPTGLVQTPRGNVTLELKVGQGMGSMDVLYPFFIPIGFNISNDYPAASYDDNGVLVRAKKEARLDYYESKYLGLAAIYEIVNYPDKESIPAFTSGLETLPFLVALLTVTTILKRVRR